MVGASARYLCLHTPVETMTPPYRHLPACRFRSHPVGRDLHLRRPFRSKSNPLRWLRFCNLGCLNASLKRSIEGIALHSSTPGAHSHSARGTLSPAKLATKWIAFCSALRSRILRSRGDPCGRPRFTSFPARDN